MVMMDVPKITDAACKPIPNACYTTWLLESVHIHLLGFGHRSSSLSITQSTSMDIFGFLGENSFSHETVENGPTLAQESKF